MAKLGFPQGDGGFSNSGARHILTAYKQSDCVNCTEGIEVGQQIMRNYGGWCHLWCMPRWTGTYTARALRRHR